MMTVMEAVMAIMRSPILTEVYHTRNIKIKKL